MVSDGSGVGLPAEESAFRWSGGRLSVNFTATVGERWRSCFERLRQPADLARWFAEAGLTDDAVAVSAVRLTQARQLREALYRLFTAVRTAGLPEATDVAVVSQWASRPVAGAVLRLHEGKLARWPAPVDASGLLGMVARDGVDLLTGPLAGRIRECAREDCALLFVDASRAGARRWCAMDACGARSKMSTYRHRRSNGTSS